MEQNLDKLKDISDKITSTLTMVDDIFNNSTTLIVEAKENGYFTRVSTAWCILLGYTKAELTSRPWIDFVLPDDIAKTNKVAKNMIEEPVANFVNRYVAKDGSVKLILWNAPVFISERSSFATASNITDITQITNVATVANVISDKIDEAQGNLIKKHE